MSNSRFVLDLQDIEWEENIKSVGLATIFKMGTATSGNYGHAGRPGYVGGSVPRRSYVSWDDLDKPTPEQTTLFNDKPKVKAKPRVVVCEEGTIPEGTLKKWKEEVRRWPADEEHDPRAQKRWVADTAIDAADSALTAVTIKNGSLMGIMSFDVSESSVYVADLATKTSGYGTDLIMKAITKAAEKKIPVKLFALSDAVPFYKKLGFVFTDGLLDSSGGSMTLSAHRCKELVMYKKDYWSEYWKELAKLEPKSGVFARSKQSKKKDVGLGLLFKMGTARSGNWGHAGRPGKVGGSAKEDALRASNLATVKKRGLYKRTFAEAVAKEKGSKYADFLGRAATWYGRDHELRTLYYVWQVHIRFAIDNGLTVPKRVVQDYKKRSKKQGMSSYKDKSLGLATIFKMGTARSGNWGHTSRSRDEANARGGSDPKNGSKRKGERANITVTEAEKAKHKIQDAKKAKQLGLRHAKRLKDGTLVWDDGTLVPKELLENLTAGIPPGLEDIYINPDKQSILDGNYAVRARSATTGGITGIYSKNAIANNTDGKWAKVRLLEREESNLTRQILRDNKYGEFLDLEDNSACLRLIQVTAIRAGDENDTKYGVYGACTLLGKHVTIKGNTAYLDFTAKHSVKQRIVVKDKFLVSDLKTRKARVGSNGSLYETNYHSKYGLLNYTKSLSKNNYTPKDFRSLRATQWALDEMSSVVMPTTKKEYAAAIKKVCAPVGALLGHVSSTGEAWSMAYNKYVDPRIFADWKKSAGV